MQKKIVYLIIFLSPLFLLGLNSPQYTGSDYIDIVLLIDSSGSMKKNDPNNLRLEAAKAFVDLANIGDQIAVLDFSTDCKIHSRLTVVKSEKDREKLKSCIDLVGSSGKMTDILTALEKALEVMKTGSKGGHSQAVILLTDGKLEIPKKSRFYGRQERGIREIAKKYETTGIGIWSVAYTKKADVDLLSRFARATGGTPYIAKKDIELLKVYINIFVDLKKKYRSFVIDIDVMPGKSFAKEVLTDEYVKEVTFAFSRSNREIKIDIQRPDGEFIEPDKAENIRIVEAEKYIIVRVIEPPVGKWNLSITGKGSVYGQVIETTDLLLVLNTEKEYFSIKDPIKISAKLMLKNVLVKDREILDGLKLNLKIISPDGGSDDIELFDTGEGGDEKVGDGIYSISYVGRALKGEYELHAVAEKKFFKREAKRRVSRGSIFEFLTKNINFGEVIKGEKAVYQLDAKSSYTDNQCFKPIILTFSAESQTDISTIESPTSEPEELIFPPGKDSKAQILLHTVELPYGSYKGQFKLDPVLKSKEKRPDKIDAEQIKPVNINFKLKVIAPVFELLTKDIDLGEVIKGKKAILSLSARSTYMNSRMFDVNILNEHHRLSFPPGEDSKAEIVLNTDNLPFGVYNDQLKLEPVAGAEEKIGIEPITPMNLSFKFEVISPPIPPNPLYLILSIALVFILCCLFILRIYEKNLPKFSGTLVYETSEGSMLQYPLLSIKKGFFKRLRRKGREIKIGKASSADIRLSGENIDDVHAVLRAEKSLKGRRVNVVINPAPGKEVTINDQPYSGISKALKHDDVIILGDQKVRYENFTLDQEDIFDFKDRYVEVE